MTVPQATLPGDTPPIVISGTTKDTALARDLQDKGVVWSAILCCAMAAVALAFGWIPWPNALLVLSISLASFLLRVWITKTQRPGWDMMIYITLLLAALGAGFSSSDMGWLFPISAYDGLRYLLILGFRQRLARYCGVALEPFVNQTGVAGYNTPLP